MLERDTIAISKIRLNGGTQLRVETDTAVVRDYTDALRRKVVFPPVRLVHEVSSDTYWLVDGFHRLLAHQAIGAGEIEADIEEGDLTLARLRACAANLDHGLRRSNETKRNVVREALGNVLTTGWSNQRIAELCGVSAPFVASMREALGLTPTKVQGKNGKVYNLADRLTEAHIFACPSLAQVEAWKRQKPSGTLAVVLERYSTYLRSIEQVQGLEGLGFLRSYGLSNAALKGPGIIHALALRISSLLEQGTDAAPHPTWDEALATADCNETWNLAKDPAIARIQREQALRAWAQWEDYSCRWPREEAATPALAARWDKVHAPPVEKSAPPPLTPERIQAMSAAELENAARGWELRERQALREVAVTTAALVAPGLVVTCSDPCCSTRWLKSDVAWCPCCRSAPADVQRRMSVEAARTDFRRKASDDPLSLVLQLLAKEPEWVAEDETLFWLRVAAWRQAGCSGLPPEGASEELDETRSSTRTTSSTRTRTLHEPGARLSQHSGS